MGAVTVLKLANASFGYGRTSSIYRDFDFELGQGKTAVLGPNGAGKSTLMRALATAIPFAAGLLLLVGKLAPDTRDTALVSGLNLLGYGALFLLCLDIGAGRYSSGFCVGFFVTTALFGHSGGHIHGWAWPLQPRPHAEAVAFVILLVVGAAIRRAWAFKNA